VLRYHAACDVDWHLYTVVMGKIFAAWMSGNRDKLCDDGWVGTIIIIIKFLVPYGHNFRSAGWYCVPCSYLYSTQQLNNDQSKADKICIHHDQCSHSWSTMVWMWPYKMYLARPEFSWILAICMSTTSTAICSNSLFASYSVYACNASNGVHNTCLLA